MCEFKINKLNGTEKEGVGEDIIYFAYDFKQGTGNSRFADILGRPLGFADAFVTEINMFESRHDITVIQSDLVPLISKFLYAGNLLNADPDNSELKKDFQMKGEELIKAIKEKIS
ncbi:MAG: hypothetical protein ACTSU2_05030 [Promethearchaeota archaeon]